MVRDDEVLATGVNTCLRDADPTAHEVEAIRAACRKLGSMRLDGAIVVSAGACPMCQAVAALSGAGWIVFAASAEVAAAAGFVAAGGAAMAAAARALGGVARIGRDASAEVPFEAWAAWLAGHDGDAIRVSPRPVSELRLAVTVADFDEAVAFYRDTFGLPELEAWATPEGRGAVLDAGRATLELVDADQAKLIDSIEVGRRVAGPIRVALEVADSTATAERLTAAGATYLGEGPVVTRGSHRNVWLATGRCS